jgi:indolepyruvate ferredoxin oxidoreductase alpha subunit
MPMRLLMGNEAIALGAVAAGISIAAGYPGTPSTEVLETIARERPDGVYVEWSVNEKAALELCAGASYSGARTLVTMKQVGLNVASDPIMSLAYIGVKGGMVVLVADDPGPISSQTEQDTRAFARYSKLPVFDPSSPEEAYAMIGDAFALSERYGTPVLFRPTTRLCHATAPVEVSDRRERTTAAGFEKDPRWVIFPRLSNRAHAAIEARNAKLSDELSDYRLNAAEGRGELGIAVSGINYAYVTEALGILGASARVLKIATPFPFPYRLAEGFLRGVSSVLAVEELDPVIERELVYLCGRRELGVRILGKETGDMPPAGENTVENITARLAEYLGVPYTAPVEPILPRLPARPPTLCAGCPHRASFYAVKRAMRGKKTVFCGDIGCYTLGNALPLDMVDTCLCMGAGIMTAQGIFRAEPDRTAFAFVGDSTFFASGITGAVNAVYNKNDIVLVVLDNGVTAMTGGQTHPGIGETLMGGTAPALSIPNILEALGMKTRVVNPLDLRAAEAAAREAAGETGARAIVFKSPCVNLRGAKSAALSVDGGKCYGCGLCVSELGCPALKMSGGKASADAGMCSGCGLCAAVCAAGAITRPAAASGEDAV